MVRLPSGALMTVARRNQHDADGCKQRSRLLE